MDIIMYTTHCPQCEVLGKKLTQKGLTYKEIDDVSKISELGITAVPTLSIEDGKYMNFKEAVNWINSLEV